MSLPLPVGSLHVNYVSDADPKCYMSDNDTDDIILRCTVQYSGNWNPKMAWRSVSGLEIPSNYTTKVCNLGVTSLTSTVERSAIPTLSSAVQFICDMFFESDYVPKPDAHSVDATNIPTYRHIWWSPGTFIGIY